MSDIAALVSDHLDIWTAATERKNGAGRGGGKRVSFYGIERLRALILDLALRGRLVPQIASHEPASDLIKRVDQERNALGAKVSKAEAVAPPPDLPDGWVAVRLAHLANPQAGFAFKSVGFNDLGVGLPLIRIRDVGQPFTGTFYSGDYRGEFVVQEGDYLISMDGEFRVATWDGPDALLNQRVARLQFYGDEVVRPFVAMALQTELTQLQGVKAYTTVDHLSGKQIAGSVIRLPPLAEQTLIVAKVDELMALCNALEGESAAALAAHQTLVETLLATLVNSADAADLAANWSCLEAHFDTLFTTEASVDALKQTILELAVSGQLVSNSGEVNPGTLDDVGDWVGGNGFPKQFQGNQEGELAFLKVSDMNLPGNERQITVSNNWVNADALRAMRARAHPVGTIIFPKIGGAIATNKRRILAVPAAIDNNCAGQIPRKGIDVDWLFMVLSSIDMATYQAGTSVPALNMKRLGKHPVAIPSTGAQREIVAKVDALMAIYDDLKARIADAGQIQIRLADTIVERAAA